MRQSKAETLALHPTALHALRPRSCPPPRTVATIRNSLTPGRPHMMESAGSAVIIAHNTSVKRAAFQSVIIVGRNPHRGAPTVLSTHCIPSVKLLTSRTIAKARRLSPSPSWWLMFAPRPGLIRLSKARRPSPSPPWWLMSAPRPGLIRFSKARRPSPSPSWWLMFAPRPGLIRLSSQSCSSLNTHTSSFQLPTTICHQILSTQEVGRTTSPNSVVRHRQ